MGVQKAAGRSLKRDNVEGDNEELLEHYLASSKEDRREKFPNTAQAAEMIGVSQRTIQFWVEIGAVQAIFIGKKCLVSADSLIAHLKNRTDRHEG